MKRLSSYQFWIAALTVNYVFVDLLRRFYAGNQSLLLLLDLNVIVIYILFFGQRKNKVPMMRMGKALPALMFLYVVTIVLQIVNPFAPDLPSAFAALRSYLLPIPFIWIGYSMMQQEGDEIILKFSRLMLILAILSITYGAYLFSTDRSGLTGVLATVLTSLEPGTHNFGEGVQQLTASFFASSWRFSTFILIAYLVLWSVAKVQQRSEFLLFCGFLVGFFVAGNRTNLSIFLVFNVIAWLFFSRSRGLLVVAYLAVLLYVFMAIDVVNLPNSSHLSDANTDLGTRIAYLFNSPEEFGQRLVMTLPTPNLDNPNILFGLGIGKYGQETAVSPAMAARSAFLPQLFFHERPGLPVADSGLTKLVIETGVFGALVFLLYFGLMMFNSLKVLSRALMRRDRIAFAVACFPVAWFLSFLKGHPTISDIGISSYLYMAVGMTLALLAQYEAAPSGRTASQRGVVQFGNRRGRLYGANTTYYREGRR